MDWLHYIATPAITGIVFAAVGWSIRSAPAEVAQGVRELRMGGVMHGLAWSLLSVLALPPFMIIYFGEWPSSSEWALAVAVFGPFGLAGWYLLRYVRRHRVVYDANGIGVMDSGGEITEVVWEDIFDVKYSMNWGFLYLYVPSGKLKVSNALRGFTPFLRELELRTGFDTSGFHSPYG